MPFRVSPIAVTSLTLSFAALGACSASSPQAPPVTAAGEIHESDETVVERTRSFAPELSGPVTRSTVIANAEQWVVAKLLYCQSANGQPDYDTSCSSTCTRESNPQWDPYRSDCSGFVSWAWELPAPGLVTSEFAPYGTSASTTIQCTDMKPGDAANRDPSTGHIVLFKEWVTPGTEAVFMEEPGCSAAQPYAHEFTSAVTCNGSSVDIAYEGTTFQAIRYIHIEDDPDAGSTSGGGDAGAGESDAGGHAASDASTGSEPDAGGASASGSSSGGGDPTGGTSSGTGSGEGASEQDAGPSGANGGTGGTGGWGGTALPSSGASSGCAVAQSPGGRPAGQGWALGSLALVLGGVGFRRAARRSNRRRGS